MHAGDPQNTSSLVSLVSTMRLSEGDLPVFAPDLAANAPVDVEVGEMDYPKMIEFARPAGQL